MDFDGDNRGNEDEGGQVSIRSPLPSPGSYVGGNEVIGDHGDGEDDMDVDDESDDEDHDDGIDYSDGSHGSDDPGSRPDSPRSDGSFRGHRSPAYGSAPSSPMDGTSPLPCVQSLSLHSLADSPMAGDIGDEDADSPGEKFYCICHQPASEVDDRFMICCDKCIDWFHGDCVGISEKKAKNVEIFYCPPCRDANPNLAIIFRLPRVRRQERPRKRSSRMCGECEACVRPDCGTCRFCEDMRKFGGPNKLRQKCMYRRCQNLAKPLSDTQMSLEAAWAKKNPEDAAEFDIMLPPKRRKRKEEREEERAAKEEERARKRAEKAEKRAEKAEKRAEKRAEKAEKRAEKKAKKGGIDKPLKERSSRSRHRLSSSGSQKVHFDRNDTYRRFQQCWGPQCTLQSRSGSKYCSDECGQALAMKRLKYYLPGRFELWSQSESLSHGVLKASIVKLEAQEEVIREKLDILKERTAKLEEIIEHSRSLVADSEEEVGDLDQDGDVDLMIDCVCCGHPTNFRRALQHMERCYSRIEGLMSFSSVFQTKSEGANIFCDFYSQGQYCKRLRVLCPDHYKGPKAGQDDVCGCPLTADVFAEALSHCLVPKRLCANHVGWERLRQGFLDMERLNCLLKLEEVQEQLHIVQEQVRAGGNFLGVLFHATVPHSDGAEKFSMLHGTAAENGHTANGVVDGTEQQPSSSSSTEQAASHLDMDVERSELPAACDDSPTAGEHAPLMAAASPTAGGSSSSLPAPDLPMDVCHEGTSPVSGGSTCTAAHQPIADLGDQPPTLSTTMPLDSGSGMGDATSDSTDKSNGVVTDNSTAHAAANVSGEATGDVTRGTHDVTEDVTHGTSDITGDATHDTGNGIGDVARGTSDVADDATCDICDVTGDVTHGTSDVNDQATHDLGDVTHATDDVTGITDDSGVVANDAASNGKSLGEVQVTGRGAE